MPAVTMLGPKTSATAKMPRSENQEPRAIKNPDCWRAGQILAGQWQNHLMQIYAEETILCRLAVACSESVLRFKYWQDSFLNRQQVCFFVN